RSRLICAFTPASANWSGATPRLDRSENNGTHADGTSAAPRSNASNAEKNRPAKPTSRRSRNSPSLALCDASSSPTPSVTSRYSRAKHTTPSEGGADSSMARSRAITAGTDSGSGVPMRFTPKRTRRTAGRARASGNRSLLDEREHLEHRQVHGDDDHADHEADADHHDRLDDARERLDRRVDFFLVEVGDLPEHLVELSGLLADLDHLRHHRREDGVLDERLRDRHAFVHLRLRLDQRFLDLPVAGGLRGDLERLDDVDAGRDERRERAREARHRDLQDDFADAHRQLELERVPRLLARLRLPPLLEAEEPADRAAEDEVPVRLQEVRRVDHVQRQGRKLSAERREHLHEERNEEEQHAREHEAREDEHHRRVHHRALHAPLELRLALDLERHAVEHLVQDPGRLTGLDHRHEEAREDLRVAAHRLAEQETAFDVAAKLVDHDREVAVVGLLLEDQQAGDDAEPRLDHRRELPREHLERLRLDRLERGAQALLAGRRHLLELLGEQTAHAQLLTRRIERRCVDLAVGRKARSVDRGVGERSHQQPELKVVPPCVEQSNDEDSRASTRALPYFVFGSNTTI